MDGGRWAILPSIVYRLSSIVCRWLFVVALAFTLTGCLLVSGERASTDTLADGGNITSTFVGADGASERTIDTGARQAELNTILIVQADRGEIQIEALNPDGSIALSVKSRPDEQVTRQGSVRTDERGLLRYRVIARGARNGGYQVLYQRTGVGG